MSRPIAIDLFAGAGGLGLGLTQAGWHVCLAVEIEADFAGTYAANHPDTVVLQRPIQTLDFRDQVRRVIGSAEVDLLAGGPPCQGFSTVGKKDFYDPRNSLYGQFLRAVDEIHPRRVLFENVAGFCTMYDGAVFEAVLESLSTRGYQPRAAILDPVNYGLPQYRPRTIIIGSRVGEDIPPWPAHTHGVSDLLCDRQPFVTLMDAISDLPPLGVADEHREYLLPAQNEYQRLLRGEERTLTEHTSSKYGDKMQEILSLVPPGGSILDVPERLRPASFFANTYARLLPDKPSPTVTRNFGTPSSSRCIHPFQNRALSTREGARLQSFPDSYRFVGKKTSKNLQIGNAVPPLLARQLGAMLLQSQPGRSRRGLGAKAIA